MTMTLGSLEEVERWVLSWGEHAKVLEPAALLQRIRHIADALKRSYTRGI